MALLTATELRAQMTATLTAESLADRYSTITNLINQQADAGGYTLVFTIGSTESQRARDWLAANGYRTELTDTAGATISNTIVGTARNIRVSWDQYTVNNSTATPVVSAALEYVISTEGVTDGTEIYYKKNPVATGQSVVSATGQALSTGTLVVADNQARLMTTVSGNSASGSTLGIILYTDSALTNLITTGPLSTVV